MSLKQQINKLTRSIRQQKEQRQRLRQALQKEARDQGMVEVEALRQQLRAQDPPATTEDWAKLVQTHVNKILGHESSICKPSKSHDEGLYIQWFCYWKEADCFQHYCVYVEPGGAATDLALDRGGNLTGGGDHFHLADDPVKDWPLYNLD